MTDNPNIILIILTSLPGSVDGCLMLMMVIIKTERCKHMSLCIQTAIDMISPISTYYRKVSEKWDVGFRYPY